MTRRVELLDTSIVVELLQVPYEFDHLDEIALAFEEKIENRVQLHLPVASVVESGAHVSRVRDGNSRRQCALRLKQMIERTLRGEAPWSFNPVAWDDGLLGELIEPTAHKAVDFVESLASRHLEMGDLLVVTEFKRLRANLDRRFVDLDVWTLDGALRAVVDELRSG